MNDNLRGQKSRKLLTPPQFSLDELLISPMRLRRVYDEDGEVSYLPLKSNRRPTGIQIFDDYLMYLTNGGSDLRPFVSRYGIRREDLDSLVFLFTGMRNIDFRLAYRKRVADEYLRYTDLSMEDVARLSGYGTSFNFFLAYKKAHGMSPLRYRARIRQKGDLGRYRVD